VSFNSVVDNRVTHSGNSSMVELVVVIVHFAEKVEQSLNALGPNPQFAIDENGFIHATSLVYDGVRNLRYAVLQNRVSSLFIVI